MAQLASPQQKSSNPKSQDQSTHSDSGSSQIDQSSQASRLGYELIYRSRQPGRLSLPLSLPESDTAKQSTGSALLDAFESDRIQQAIPLRNLRLIKIAEPGQLTEEVSPAPQYPPVTVLIKQDKSGEKRAEPEKPVPEKPVPEKPVLEKPVSKQPLPKKPVTEKRLPSKQTPKAGKVTGKTSVPAPASLPSIQKLSPPSAQKALANRLGGNVGKAARDSAAAVGLLDLNDTLLFGGDHSDLSCMDPFMNPAATAGPDGILTYLSQQISAFTVARLSNNFPINTHLAVLSQEDEPKRLTVLDLKTFRLDDLTEDPEDDNTAIEQHRAQTRSETQPETQSAGDNTNIAELTQQLHALNRKVEDLSRQLQNTSNQ